VLTKILSLCCCRRKPTSQLAACSCRLLPQLLVSSCAGRCCSRRSAPLPSVCAPRLLPQLSFTACFCSALLASAGGGLLYRLLPVFILCRMLVQGEEEGLAYCTKLHRFSPTPCPQPSFVLHIRLLGVIYYGIL
jgi:hypothetical protein